MGALHIGSANGITVTIRDSEFLNNINDESGYDGGAIQTYSVVDLNVKGSTFANNVSYDPNAFFLQKGAAIASAKYWRIPREASVSIQDSLFAGNGFYNTSGSFRTSSKNNNFNTPSSSTTDLGGNVGFDNSSNPGSNVTTENILGNYPTTLSTNLRTVVAGRYENRVIVPTLPIMPSDGTRGLANQTGTKSTTHDQRGYLRSLSSRAVDISWLRYDANGGNFTMSEMTAFNGTEYYEGTTPKTYDDIAYNGYATHVATGSGLGITHSDTDKVFLGWSTDKNATVADVSAGSGITMGDTNTTLYAVWEVPVQTFTVTFETNGGSTIASL